MGTYREIETGKIVSAIQFKDEIDVILNISNLVGDEKDIGIDYGVNPPVLKVYAGPAPYGPDDIVPDLCLSIAEGDWIVRHNDELMGVYDHAFRDLYYQPIDPRPRRGAIIPISLELFSELLSEKLGIKLQVMNVDNLHYAQAIGVSVVTEDERFPEVKEGERLRDVSPILYYQIDEEGNRHTICRGIETYDRP